jgi:hypothetical protein
MGMTFDLCWVRVLPCGERVCIEYDLLRDTQQTVPLSELSEDILRKLVVLRMVDKGQEIEDIGRKWGPQSFLIYL